MSADRRSEINQWMQQRTTEAVQAYMQRMSLSRREAAQRFGMSPTTLHTRLSGDSDWTLTDVLYLAEVMNVRLIP